MLVDFAGETPSDGHTMLKEVMGLGTGGIEYNVDWRWPDGMCDIDCNILIHQEHPKGKESHLYFQHAAALSQFLFYMANRQAK